MASITVAGVGSGLDVNQIVSDLIAAEKEPATKRLDQKEELLQAKLSAIGTFKGALSDFNSSLTAINSAAKLQNLRATVSNEDLFTASATSIAQAGDYNIEVRQRAQAQKLVTDETQRFANVTDVVGSGTLTFQVGSYDGATFTADPAKAAKTITIDASNNTLDGLRDAINKADVGARASIINDGQGFRLVISASESGVANSLKITVSDTGDGNNTDLAGLSMLAYDPEAASGSGKNLTQTLEAQDALLRVDGLDISSASNSVVGVVPGVTLNLKSAEIGTIATLSVTQDSAETIKSVDSFVAAYNALIENANSLTFYDPETREQGVLTGDSSIRSIISQIRNVMTGAVAGVTGSRRSLADIGISFQKDGSLKLDSAKLQTALTEDPENVAALFARTGSTTDPLVTYKTASSTSIAGTYNVSVTQLATQGQYTGASINGGVPAPFIVDDNNNNFAIKVNSVQAGASIILNNGTYNSGVDMAAELQRQINANTTLINASALLSVSYQSSNNSFTFASDAYGSTSSVEFTQISTNFTATFGVSVAAGTAGQDVAGSIGAEEGTGSGRTLTGAGTAAGIAVNVIGGVTGSRGTVSLSGGIAQQLDTLIDNFLSTGGLLSNRTDSLNSQIDDVSEQRDALDKRMDALETRYRAQFTAMDALVGRLTATSNYLTQQFFNTSNTSQ